MKNDNIEEPELNYDGPEIKQCMISANFPKIVLQIRKDYNLTQKQFADSIHVSNRTVSKWEKAQAIPDLNNIQDICEVYNVSTKAIINYKKTLKDYERIIRRKIQRLVNWCLGNVLAFFALILIFLLFQFFINNYNAVSLSKLQYTSDNITIGNSYLIKSKVLNILVINKIELENIDYDPVTTDVLLYTYANGDKFTIYTNDVLEDIYIEENSRYPNLLSQDVVEGIKHNLYLEITTTDKNDKEYIYKSVISPTDRFRTDKLSYETFEKDSKFDNTYQVFIDKKFPDYYLPDYTDDYKSNEQLLDDEDHDNKLRSLGYSYDKEFDTYTKVDKYGGTITYVDSLKLLKYRIIENGLTYDFEYKIDRNQIELRTFNKLNTLKMFISYSISESKVECITGDCKKIKNYFEYILGLHKGIAAIL